MHGAFLELLCSNWCSSKIEMGVSGNFWSCLKEVNPLVVYDVECGMAVEPMERNQASSRVDLGLPEVFRIAAVTSVSFNTWNSILGDSLEFHQANQGYLCV